MTDFPGNALHTATHCNILQRTATHYDTLQHTATYCNTLRCTAPYCNALSRTTMVYPRPLCQVVIVSSHVFRSARLSSRTATHCNTLQHSGTLCNTLQHSTLCSILQRTATQCNELPSRLATMLSHPFRSVPTLYMSAHPVCCSVLQCVAVCGSVWQCVAVHIQCSTGLSGRIVLHCNALQHSATLCNALQHSALLAPIIGTNKPLANNTAEIVSVPSLP